MIPLPYTYPSWIDELIHSLFLLNMKHLVLKINKKKEQISFVPRLSICAGKMMRNCKLKCVRKWAVMEHIFDPSALILRQRQGDLCEFKASPSLHSKFQESQSYRERPTLKQAKLMKSRRRWQGRIVGATQVKNAIRKSTESTNLE